VVASEVKQLATQTARSTEEISRHIGEVRSATGASVAAVGRIEETISEINAIAGSIAAAVEQQGAATAEIARNVSETAAAANEMTNRTQEVSAEASQTGQRAAEARENTYGLESAVHSLHRTVVHLARTATNEVDRRRYRRRSCLAEATLETGGQSVAATLYDISERGCCAATDVKRVAGQALGIALPRFGVRLAGNVVAQSDQGLHIAFTGGGLAPAEADRISVTTIAELVQKAKDDHVAFVQRVADIVASGEKQPPDHLPSPHHCRFGRWYDRVSDAAALSLASYKAIQTPHQAVHELGRRALIAAAGDDAATAQLRIAEMRQQSDRVLKLLDAFARDYPTLFTAAAASARRRNDPLMGR
jgi:hypothetical protein